jgi:iron complex transport system substrate-binding protein
MRIVALEPYIADIVVHIGLGEQLIGVPYGCSDHAGAEVVTSPSEGTSASLQVPGGSLLSEVLRSLAPTHILAGLPLPERSNFDATTSLESQTLLSSIRSLFEGTTPVPQIVGVGPVTLSQIFDSYHVIGRALGCPEKGREVAQRMRAQFMDWGDNFYDRMKNKRVTVLSGVSPLMLAGRWIPDLINLASCISQQPNPGGPDVEITWKQVIEFRPDVLIVAPRKLSHDEALGTFKILERLPDFEVPPAVRRGEVFFFPGEQLIYRPGPKLLEGMGILISAIAGIDSGYITPRDSFQRLRYLEMQRHRF